MPPRFLLDTHIVVRWLVESKKLTREQARSLDDATRRAEPLGLSAVTLLEIAVWDNTGKIRGPLRDFLANLEAHPLLRILPLSYEVATEVSAMGDSLRDPSDRAIVATARVYGLRLITSDQRIIQSRLVSVVE